MVLRTRSQTDVVEGKLGNTRVELEQEGEGLANAAGSTKDSNLGELDQGQNEEVSRGTSMMNGGWDQMFSGKAERLEPPLQGQQRVPSKVLGAQ